MSLFMFHVGLNATGSDKMVAWQISHIQNIWKTKPLNTSTLLVAQIKLCSNIKIVTKWNGKFVVKVMRQKFKKELSIQYAQM